MKPKKLRLKNFGPFIDETIDFSRLTEAPLFLISGKTGAGKTTIFDGMTYALFGETSGKLRSGKEMRSLFATPEEETSVIFSFEHQKMNYEVERKPEQLLAKRKGEGNRKQAAKVTLTIFDEKGKELKQFTKRSEADQLIREMMNLDAKQFSQIVLLPQGEFRNFLVSSSSDKEIVLRNLFGTHFFQQFNERLKEKSKNQQKKLDHLEQALYSLQKRFVFLDDEASADDDLGFDAVLAQWENEQLTIEKQIEEEKQSLKKQQSAQKQLEIAYYRFESLQKQQEEKTKLLQKQQELADQKSEIEEKKRWIGYYEFTQKLIEPITRKKEYEKEQEELSQSHEEYSRQLAQLLLAYREWQKKEPERLAQQSTVKQLSEALQMKQTLIPIAKEWQKKQETIRQLETQQAEKQETRQQLRQSLTNWQKKLGHIEQVLSGKEQLQKDRFAYEKLQQVQKSWKEIQKQQEKAASERNQCNDQLEKTSKKIANSRRLLIEQKQQVVQLKSQWAKQQIARLTLLLVPGEPCPVCGSVEHPNVQKIHEQPNQEEITAVEQQLAEAETAVERTSQELGRKEADEAKLQQQLLTLKEHMKDLQVEADRYQQKLKTKINEEFLFAAADDLTVSFTKIEESLDERIREFAEAETQHLSITQELAEIELTLSNQEKQLAEINEQLQRAQGEIQGLNRQLNDQQADSLEEEAQQLAQQVEVKTRQLANETAAGTELNQQVQVLEAQLQSIHLQQEKAAVKIQKEQQKIEEQLSSQTRFSTQEEICTFGQQQAYYEEAVKAVARYHEDALVTATRLSQLENVHFEEETQDMEQLSSQLDMIREEVNLQQERVYKLQEQKESNQKIYQEFAAIYQASQQQLDELIQMQQLSQTINGENPRKTSLERYVLQVYLQEVLQVANEHLQRLTKNRYQFELAETVGSYRGKTGLEINVYDDEAGMTRSAHTLSGGESFIAALSLALALAEVIQTQTGGVTIEALFIDEGFGSLDEEALEMAMEALETIENEGRMIGIISHVRELKERILQQIRIETEGSGQSKVRYHLG